MRSSSFGLIGAAFVMAAGCGPAGPGSLEGFGDVGETEDLPTTVGDGDPGDGDPGDGDPGDGDGDPGDCIDADYGNAPQFFFDAIIDPEAPSDHAGQCEPTPGPDYSIAWTAPASGPYYASMSGEFPGWLTMLRGGCDGILEQCAGWDFPNTVYFDAIAGQRYTFVVDTIEPGFGGWFEFFLEPLIMPNDCPQGELFGQADSVSGSTNGASSSFGSLCGGEDAPDHAYLFMPPISGVYHIDMFGSNYDTMLHVFEGFCGGPLVDCNDDSLDLQSEVWVELFAGQIYTIVADGWGNESGNYDLNVELVDGGEQLCDDVEVLFGVPAAADWLVDQTSTNLFGGCTFTSNERRFVWNAPSDGLYRVSQDAFPLYSGVAVLLGGCDGGGELLCAITGFDQEPSVEFPAFEGQEIVFVSEWEMGPPTQLSLLVEAVGGGEPGCGEALDPGVPSFASGNSLGSGNNYSGTCSSGPAPEVEYWWTAPATGSYRITTEGSNYDTLIYVRDGGCDGPELACNDDTFQGQDVFLWSTIDIDLSVGQTISIFVDGYNGSGTYQLAITEL